MKTKWILLTLFICLCLCCKNKINYTKLINELASYPGIQIDTNYFITSKYMIDSVGLYALYDSPEQLITSSISNIEKFFPDKDIEISSFIKITYDLGLATYKNDKGNWNTYLVIYSDTSIKDTLFVNGYQQFDENTILRRTFDVPKHRVKYIYNPERINTFERNDYIINVYSEYITDSITYSEEDQYTVSMTPFFSNIDIAKNEELLATYNLEDLKHYSLNGINRFFTVEDPLEFEPDWEKYVRILKNHDKFNLVIKRHSGGVNGRYFLYVLKNDTIDFKNSLLIATKREAYAHEDEDYRYFSVIYNDFTIKRFYATGEEADNWDTEEYFKIDDDGNFYKVEQTYNSENQSFSYEKSDKPMYENFHITYKYLQPIDLADNEIKPTNTKSLMEPYYPLFHNIYFDSVDEAYITKLPDTGNPDIIALILRLFYDSGESSNFLYTFDSEFNILSKMQLNEFYEEENGDFTSMNYSISEEYIFTLETKLNGNKIRENYYKIDTEGKIVEITTQNIHKKL